MRFNPTRRFVPNMKKSVAGASNAANQRRPPPDAAPIISSARITMSDPTPPTPTAVQMLLASSGPFNDRSRATKYVLLDCRPKFPNCASVCASVTIRKYSPRPDGLSHRAVSTLETRPPATINNRVATVATTGPPMTPDIDNRLRPHHVGRLSRAHDVVSITARAPSLLQWDLIWTSVPLASHESPTSSHYATTS